MRLDSGLGCESGDLQPHRVTQPSLRLDGFEPHFSVHIISSLN